MLSNTPSSRKTGFIFPCLNIISFFLSGQPNFRIKICRKCSLTCQFSDEPLKSSLACIEKIHRIPTIQPSICVCSISKSSFPPWQVEVFHLLPSKLHNVVSHVIMYLHHIAKLQESCREQLQRMSQDSVLGRKELQCCPVLQY